MARFLVSKAAKACWLAREDGALTVINLFLLCAIAMLAGVAIDVSNVISARTQLQATADTAAHAALVEREWHSSEDAKAKAIDVAVRNMPASRYGNVLSPAHISFGDYDRVTRTFTARDASRSAVMVQAEQLSESNNAVKTFLLHFAGLWGWDVRARSVFETYTPTCLREGFVAENVIDIQSNNSYFNGFCLHSNRYIKINNNNFFEPGTVVSMPDINDMVV